MGAERGSLGKGASQTRSKNSFPLEAEMQPAEKIHPWYALRIRPQHEKVVARALRNKGYEEFLPLYRYKRRWSDRFKEIESPLFPGYVFCRFDVHNRLPILVTPGVVLIVGIGKIPLPVDDDEIAALQTVVKSGLQAEPWPFLKIGQRVRIERGSLEGVEGILVAIKRPYRLVISITLLQRSVAVEIDHNWASPIGPAPFTPPDGETRPLARKAVAG
jgi:transcription antitermination factor NusG